jgi:hypothetical protein
MKENFEFTSGGEGCKHPVRLRRPPLQRRGIVNHPRRQETGDRRQETEICDACGVALEGMTCRRRAKIAAMTRITMYADTPMTPYVRAVTTNANQKEPPTIHQTTNAKKPTSNTSPSMPSFVDSLSSMSA